ncbi:MAG: RagB/SusD family nutrient uptake outer membrane protein [Bacteroidales bacterium]|nr:RagB/SusD family nutrient uptake outer membrane protein [Bacteroidales bacterium]
MGLLLSFSSCNNYLDIVPDDGIATLETAFNLRTTAIRYLYTCYGFLTSDGDLDGDHGLLSGDEIWTVYDRRESDGYFSGNLFNIARGFQGATSTYGNDWNGIYEAIRCCNILIEKANTVPDLPAWEAAQWISEAKVLKAYYHFHLIRKWGPIPLIKDNLPIDAPVDQVRVYRDPIDSCFNYVLQLLDESMADLPLVNQSRDEWGRITRPIAASLKAKVSVFAASPLFNNNKDQATIVDKRGTHLFATDKTDEQVNERWTAAVKACKEAIDICHEANMEIYYYDGNLRLNDTLKTELNLRNAFNEKWNTEIIWGNTHTSGTANSNIQFCSSPNLQWIDYPDIPSLWNNIQAPYKIAQQYYTNNGLPIENDKKWAGVDPMTLRTGDYANRWYIRQDYVTDEFNFNREPRFYAWLGFDGGQWFGQKASLNDLNPSDLFWVACRVGGNQQKKGYDWGPITGYYLKKFIHYQNRQTSATEYSTVYYPWPMIRLSDLYLMYAEAINEAEGPTGANSEEMFKYINLVRERANIPDVKTAWDNFSNAPGKYKTAAGMREIIHRERLIELSFEGHRYWDLRRWKEAPAEYSKGIYGYKVTASKAADYYQLLKIADQTFSLKDYFWPIPTSYIEQNPNLVQNLGW